MNNRIEKLPFMVAFGKYICLRTIMRHVFMNGQIGAYNTLKHSAYIADMPIVDSASVGLTLVAI